MVLVESRSILDKDKLVEYAKCVREEMVPYWLSVPGLKELRAYREMGSFSVLVELEFDSFESYGKAMDDPKTKEIMSKWALYTHDFVMKVWDVSPLVPQALKPKK